ncbi:hypothetical protein HDV00_007092 [Rhizophlyctis rosea]|nr:hypothetical protein HDV00_007092 [Rhizophlyctis rosea]
MDLCTAAHHNDEEGTAQLLEDGLNPNAYVPWCPTSHACTLDLRNTLQNDESDSDAYDALPLHMAVMAGNVGVVNLLVKAGASLTRIDGRGRPATYAAVTRTTPEHLSLARLIMDGLLALPDGYRSFIKLVDGPQNAPDLRGITPLCLAAYLGKSEMVQTLLEGGANSNAQDVNGATALMYAARDGHVDVVNILLKYQARVNLSDKNGWTALQYGSTFPVIVQMMKAALSGVTDSLLPADLMQDLETRYPKFRPSSLHCENYPSRRTTTSTEAQRVLYAIKTNDLHTLARILDSPLCVDPNKVDGLSGQTFLHFALRIRPVRYPETETIVRMLVTAGANVNARNAKTGKTGLHYLMRDPYANPTPTKSTSTRTPSPRASSTAPTTIQSIVYAIARFLLQSGANPNVPDLEGNRPLHYATKTNNFDLVRLLIEGHASPDVHNNARKKPVDMCVGLDGRIRTLLTGRTESVVEYADPLLLGRLSFCVQRESGEGVCDGVEKWGEDVHDESTEYETSPEASDEYGTSPETSDEYETSPEVSVEYETAPEEAQINGEEKSEIENADTDDDCPSLLEPHSDTSSSQSDTDSLLSSTHGESRLVSALLAESTTNSYRTFQLESLLTAQHTNLEAVQAQYRARIAALESEIEACRRVAGEEVAEWRRRCEEIEGRVAGEVEGKRVLVEALKRAVEGGSRGGGDGEKRPFAKRAVTVAGTRCERSNARAWDSRRGGRYFEPSREGFVGREVSGSVSPQETTTSEPTRSSPSDMISPPTTPPPPTRTESRPSTVLSTLPTEENDTLLTSLLYSLKQQTLHLRACLDTLTFEHAQLMGTHEATKRQALSAVRALDGARRREAAMEEWVAGVMERCEGVVGWGEEMAEGLQGCWGEVFGEGGLVRICEEVAGRVEGMGRTDGKESVMGKGADVGGDLEVLKGGIRDAKGVLQRVLVSLDSTSTNDGHTTLSPQRRISTQQTPATPPSSPPTTIQTMLDHLSTLRHEIARMQRAGGGGGGGGSTTTASAAAVKPVYRDALEGLTRSLGEACGSSSSSSTDGSVLGLGTKIGAGVQVREFVGTSPSGRRCGGRRMSPVTRGAGRALGVLVEEEEV